MFRKITEFKTSGSLNIGNVFLLFSFFKKKITFEGRKGRTQTDWD